MDEQHWAHLGKNVPSQAHSEAQGRTKKPQKGALEFYHIVSHGNIKMHRKRKEVETTIILLVREQRKS